MNGTENVTGTVNETEIEIAEVVAGNDGGIEVVHVAVAPVQKSVGNVAKKGNVKRNWKKNAYVKLHWNLKNPVHLAQ